jgi:cytochrome c-type biogenesis protein CcmH/NrfG
MELEPSLAAGQLRDLLRGDPLNADAYRLLAQALRLERPREGRGEIRSGSVTATDVQLARAASALRDDDLETAEIILRPKLRERPDDVVALRLLAEFADRLNYAEQAEQLLRYALEVAPQSHDLLLSLGALLHRRNRPEEALQFIEQVLATSPTHVAALTMCAAAHARAGKAKEAAAAYEKSLQAMPDQARTWMHYGQLLRTMGRKKESISALRHAIDLDPRSGELWWGLSDSKTYRFGEEDIARMTAALADRQSDETDCLYLHFALGKAYEDQGDHGVAFRHLSAGNDLQKRRIDYDPQKIARYVDQAQLALDRAFFRARNGTGAMASDPTFVIGMPRSGSTLIEQILASHADVEATFELPDLLELADELSPELTALPSRLSELAPEQLKSLGDAYLTRTRRYRASRKPRFVDKMPNNWVHVPLIQLALPNARIVDIRRHPLACGISNFKQLFVGGQGFSNDLQWFGRYYADYVRFMEHIDTVLPGRVHRIHYEQLVNDLEGEVLRLLDYLGLAFDPACLRYYELERVVRTTSSEQVRRPIDPAVLERWRGFEPWLGPLKSALGPVLDAYPNAPRP